MTIEEQRKAFEAYFKDKYPELYKDVFDEDGDDRAIIGYSFALSAWLASANREGYKLVPVEPTQGMIDKAVCDTPETPSQDYWHSGQPVSDDQAIACYKAMIGAIE